MLGYVLEMYVWQYKNWPITIMQKSKGFESRNFI